MSTRYDKNMFLFDVFHEKNVLMERRKMFLKMFFFTGNLNKEQVRLGQVLQDKENIIQVRI